ncbi:hypothetical protein CSHISOI_11441, partial [Colletotrichum shisoi]
MIRFLVPRYGSQSTPVITTAAFIALAFVYLLRFNGHITPFTSASFSFRTSRVSGLNLDAINSTAQYFVDYPLGPPYKKVFCELGERTKVLRSWIEALEEKNGDGLRFVGAERQFLDETVERVASSLFPYVQSPPRDIHSQSPLADLRRSFSNAGAHARHPARHPAQQQQRVGGDGDITTDYAHRNAGIVIPTGRGTLRFACHLVASLRRVYWTKLPIQIVYAGDEDLSQGDRDTIAEAAAGGDDGPVEFLDILTVFNDTTLRLAEGGWAIKPFAALGSRFEEVILLDADDEFPDRHAWYHEMIKHPSEELQKSLVWTERYAEEGDSGVVVLDKGRLDVLMGLLHTCWQNSYDVRMSWTYRITYGDKETWWIGLETTGAAYAFSRHYGGMVGWRKPLAAGG